MIPVMKIKIIYCEILGKIIFLINKKTKGS